MAGRFSSANRPSTKLLLTSLRHRKGCLINARLSTPFKRYESAHTGKAIGAWLASEHEAKGLLPQYVGYHCTDGASNAVASVNEYGILTEINRDTPINHQECLAHQTNHSAKFASGTGDFVFVPMLLCMKYLTRHTQLSLMCTGRQHALR